MRMLDRYDSLLVVVDAQPGFFDAGHDTAGVDATGVDATGVDSTRHDRAFVDGVVARIAWLVGVARALGIPIVITEEDPARNGPTAPAVLARVPDGAPAHVKPVFGLADTPAIMAAIEETGRRTIVLVGFETDVCVSHSALGLLDRSYRVAVVTDATGSPGRMHAFGLRRMRDAGATLVHAKGVYYEWVRTLEAARAFEAANPGLADPPGFAL
jgi:nicotinamidase-related amidase